MRYISISLSYCNSIFGTLRDAWWLIRFDSQFCVPLCTLKMFVMIVLMYACIYLKTYITQFKRLTKIQHLLTYLQSAELVAACLWLVFDVEKWVAVSCTFVGLNRDIRIFRGNTSGVDFFHQPHMEDSYFLIGARYPQNFFPVHWLSMLCLIVGLHSASEFIVCVYICFITI